jgi:hypothetical protein
LKPRAPSGRFGKHGFYGIAPDKDCPGLFFVETCDAAHASSKRYGSMYRFLSYAFDVHRPIFVNG